jgi:hypothetical protein
VAETANHLFRAGFAFRVVAPFTVIEDAPIDPFTVIEDAPIDPFTLRV